jgi:hypothetical protein
MLHPYFFWLGLDWGVARTPETSSSLLETLDPAITNARGSDGVLL